jgi:hypothetical protein
MIPDQEIPVSNLPPELWQKILKENRLGFRDFDNLVFKITYDKTNTEYFCRLKSLTRETVYPLKPETTKLLISFLMKEGSFRDKG